MLESLIGNETTTRNIYDLAKNKKWAVQLLKLACADGTLFTKNFVLKMDITEQKCEIKDHHASLIVSATNIFTQILTLFYTTFG
jgi:hypothetical protein